MSVDQNQSLSDSYRLRPQVVAGDRSSLWGFTEALRPYLKQVVRSHLDGKLSEKFDESDVVQAALTRAIENIGQFHGDTEEEWKAWLAAICQNESRNAIRHWLRQRRNAAMEQGLSDPVKLAGDDTGASGQLNRQEIVDKVLLGISELTEDQQLLIQWRHFEDLSHDEIAQRLGVSVEAARKRWQSTLVQLKKRLNQLGGDPSN